MKFKGSIEIDRPQARVAELFADPGNLKEFQDGFIKKVLVSKQAGEEGAVSKMYYKFGKRDMELTETVIENRLPDSFLASYHHKHMDNTMKSTFVALGENKTRYDYEVEYTRVSWVIPKLMITLFSAMFKKQSDKWMNQFKAFAEKS
ncbi:MAG: SRPBCC family protein [Bacteroidota bacterium]